MDVYSIDLAIEIIKQKTGQSCDPIMLASMFMSKKINVCLVYGGYICEVDIIQIGDEFFGDVLACKHFDGSIKLAPNSDIAGLINGKVQNLSCDFVHSPKGIAVFLYGDKQFYPDDLPKDLDDLKLNPIQPSTINITRHELVFTMASINTYITGITGTSIAAKYVKPEKEHEKLKVNSKKLNEDLAELNSKKVIKKTGISPAKVNAKLAAATLAEKLWREDKNQKIKILEMAITVYSELYQTEHKSQLPNNQGSLKEWIKHIAPTYAREAGRPTEK